MSEHGDVIIPFGKHKGRTIDDIAGDNDGLRYLDWLRGQDWLFADIREALDGYLDDPVIARELDNALDDD